MSVTVSPFCHREEPSSKAAASPRPVTEQVTQSEEAMEANIHEYIHK